VLAEAGESVGRFLESGVAELGDRLGPILWQFAPTKRFDAGDFEAFLKLLPTKSHGVPLRHALEVRHPSFAVPEFPQLARRYGAAICYAHHHDYPGIADVTADFVYARLQRGKDDIATAYPEGELEEWARRAKAWASGEIVEDLPVFDTETRSVNKSRDVFVYFIHEGKVRAPHAAQAFMARIGQE
jgi:uncharacterized protein YecE (DUF72 family)